MNGFRLGPGCLRPLPVALQFNLQPRIGKPECIFNQSAIAPLLTPPLLHVCRES